MITLGYYNGKYDELENMSVPMLDRACYFGDGVYDVTYSRNYHIFSLQEHIDRFYQSAEKLSIAPPLCKNDLATLLQELVNKLDSGNQWVYMQLSRGTGRRDHAFLPSTDSNLWIMLKPAEIRDTYRTLRCITREDTRFLHCDVKSLNLIPNILAKQAAVEAGADECILHRGEKVTECSHSNLFILKSGTLFTHPANEKIYAGTGRAHLIALAEKKNVPVIEEAFTLSELFDADEVLLVSASALCMRIVEVNGKPVGGKAIEAVKVFQDALLADYLRQTE